MNNKVFEYASLILALLGLYNLGQLTMDFIHGVRPNPATVWLFGGATILAYIINKVLEKYNKK
jgi:hypothetical protein